MIDQRDFAFRFHLSIVPSINLLDEKSSLSTFLVSKFFIVLNENYYKGVNPNSHKLMTSTVA